VADRERTARERGDGCYGGIGKALGEDLRADESSGASKYEFHCLVWRMFLVGAI